MNNPADHHHAAARELLSKCKVTEQLAAPHCSPPPYELACRMLNAIGWNGNDFRLRDPVALAIAPEVERINRRVKEGK